MPARGRPLLETPWMNCVVSSIHPPSSTAPACRNISQGERACRAPAASAAACEPSNRKKRQPETSATRSITPVPARSTGNTSRITPAAAPGTSAAKVATAGCSTPSVGMITLSIDGSSMSQRRENADCYHLVTIKTACPLQLFAATGVDGQLAARNRGRGDAGLLTLRQFCGAMSRDRRLLAGGNDENVDLAVFGADRLLRLMICGR